MSRYAIGAIQAADLAAQSVIIDGQRTGSGRRLHILKSSHWLWRALEGIGLRDVIFVHRFHMTCLHSTVLSCARPQYLYLAAAK